jgi:ABC-2 type transport system permease protein
MWAVIRYQWIDYLAFRGFLVYWFVIESLPFFVMFFLWNFIYIGHDIVNGFTLSAMITYYFLGYFVRQFTQNYIDWSLVKRINKGTFSQFLYRPLSHQMYLGLDNVAEKIMRFIVTFPVLFLMVALLHNYLFWNGWNNFGYFLLGLGLSFLLNLYLTFFLGYSAFWMEKSDAILYFKNSLIYYLSGSLIPLSFFGPQVAGLLSFLPFRYMVSFPIELYLGKLTSGEIKSGFLVGFVWVVIFILLEKVIFAKGIKKFSAVGN